MTYSVYNKTWRTTMEERYLSNFVEENNVEAPADGLNYTIRKHCQYAEKMK